MFEDYIVENDDGSMTVNFDDRPLLIDGVQVTSLRMREPTVNDELIASKAATALPEAEVAMIANLCEQSPDAIKGLKSRQYKRLQAALTGFLG